MSMTEGQHSPLQLVAVGVLDPLGERTGVEAALLESPEDREESVVLEHSPQIDERSRRSGDRNALFDRDLRGAETYRAMNADASAVPPAARARDDHVDRTAWRWRRIPQGRSEEVTEAGTSPTRVDRGEPMALGPEVLGRNDRVDALVHPVQTSTRNSTGDGSVVEPCLTQVLRAEHGPRPGRSHDLAITRSVVAFLSHP
jgi:hypothetical protein